MNNGIISSSAPWIQAIGTVMSAVGSTPWLIRREQTRQNLNLWGNVLQASGNALQADQIKQLTLDKIGNEIQASGNTVVIAGMVLPVEKETGEKLIITGNWFQALGGLLSMVDEMESDSPQAINIVGNLMQSIGNSLQAVGGAEELKGKEDEGESLEVTGSWIQAVGSVLTALGSSDGTDEKSQTNEHDNDKIK